MIPAPKKGNMWIGAMFYYYSRMMFYAGAFSFIMTVGIFWHTTLSQSIDMPFGLFILLSFIIGIIALALDYLWFTPAFVAYCNKISVEQNPVLDKINEMQKEISEIKEAIESELGL